MSDYLDYTTLGGLQRVSDTIVAAGPTLLIGLGIAAVLRFYLGPSGTRGLFGGDSLRALPQSWAIGMLLPVCSIGVIPILIEMRRSRIKPGAMTAFALSAPLFNPLSLLYGLTLSRPYVIAMFALGSLLVVTLVGLAWDWWILREESGVSDESDDPMGLEKGTLIGINRLQAMIVYVSRQLLGPVGGWTFLAALGMFLLAWMLPAQALQHGVHRDDWMAPARMAAVAVPVYATPMLAISQLGAMFQHANSPGAAFILLVVGAGVNLGTLAWLCRQFSLRAVTIWFTCLMVIVVGIAYAINRPLIPPGVTPLDHTHAFDIYTNPISSGESTTVDYAISKWKKSFGVYERVILSVLGGLLSLGLLFRCFGIQEKRFIVPTPDVATANQQDLLRFDRIVSSQTVGGTLLAGLVAVSVVMCYGFYPSPEECIKELKFVRAEALPAAMSGKNEHAKYWIPRWDEWSRRLEVGAYIRRFKVTPYQRMQGYLIRKKLDILEHELEHDHDDPKLIRDLVHDLLATDNRWINAYRDTPAPIESFGTQPPAVGLNEDSHDTHGHNHRHEDSPHGGRMIPLEHDRHDEQQHNLHLEVMPIEDNQVVVYMLRFNFGKFRAVRNAGSVMQLSMTPIGKQQELDEFSCELTWDADTRKFYGTLPEDQQSNRQFGVLATYMHTDDSKLHAQFELVSKDEATAENQD